MNIKTVTSSHSKNLAIVFALTSLLMTLLPQLPAEATPPTCAQGGVCVVGDTGPGGGKIFYVEPASASFSCGPTLSSRCRYLEAAPTSGTDSWTDASYSWSGNIDTLIDTTGTAIGTGYQNTLEIFGQDETPNRAGTVAIAYRGPNNKTDWYLPAKNELDQLYVQRAIVGGIPDARDYWSSTESNSLRAQYLYTGYSNQQSVSGTALKSNSTLYVRPIRAVPITYTLTLASGTDGSGGGTTLTKTNGVSLTLDDSSEANTYFTRAGYRVTGWSTSDGGAQTYALSGTFRIDADTTLYPVWTLISNIGTCELIVNGSFEVPRGVSRPYLFRDKTYPDHPGIGWITTETDADPLYDHQIEFWDSTVDQNVSPVDGLQLIEMNKGTFSGIYQDIPTTPGSTITWSLSHRGRSGFDQMAVRLGPATGPVALPLANNSHLIRQGTSLNPDDNVLRDDNSAWGTYSGSYLVPAGQTTTRFYMESVSVTDYDNRDDELREIFNYEVGESPGYGNLVDNVSVTSSSCGSTPAPAYVEPVPVPYLKSVTAPKLNLKDGKLICTAGTYQTGYTFGSDVPTGGPSNFTPSNYIYNLLANGVAQSAAATASSTNQATWSISQAILGSTHSCSVTVSANSLTITNKSTENTEGLGAALATQSKASEDANTQYNAVLNASASAYRKALVDNRLKWRAEIAAIRGNYYEAIARIGWAGSSKKLIIDKSTALKFMITAQRKSAADYAASKPAAIASKEAANKTALEAKNAAVAKANATFGTFIESIGHGVLIP